MILSTDIEEKIIQLSLKHNLLTKYTSFLAIREGEENMIVDNPPRPSSPILSKTCKRKPSDKSPKFSKDFDFDAITYCDEECEENYQKQDQPQNNLNYTTKKSKISTQTGNSSTLSQSLSTSTLLNLCNVDGSWSLTQELVDIVNFSNYRTSSSIINQIRSFLKIHIDESKLNFVVATILCLMVLENRFPQDYNIWKMVFLKSKNYLNSCNVKNEYVTSENLKLLYQSM